MTGALIIGTIACLVILIMNKSDKSILTSRKWLVVIPIAVICLIGYLCVDLENSVVPEGSYMTKSVAVEDENSRDIYYWSLRVSVYDDESHYKITGYVSPKTGKLVNAESRESDRFGERVEFSENFNNSEFSASVNKKDVDVSYSERLAAVGLLDILACIAIFILGVVDLVIMVKIIGTKEEDIW